MTTPAFVRAYQGSTSGNGALSASTTIDTTGLGANGAIVIYQVAGENAGNMTLAVFKATLGGSATGWTEVIAETQCASSATGMMGAWVLLNPTSNASIALVGGTSTGGSIGSQDRVAWVACLYTDVASVTAMTVDNDGASSTSDTMTNAAGAGNLMTGAWSHGSAISSVTSGTARGTANNAALDYSNGCIEFIEGDTIAFSSASSDSNIGMQIKLTGTGGAAAPAYVPPTKRRARVLFRPTRGKITPTPPAVVPAVAPTYRPPIQRRTRFLPRPPRGKVTPTPPAVVVLVAPTYRPPISRRGRLLPRPPRGRVTNTPTVTVTFVPQIQRRSLFLPRIVRGKVTPTPPSAIPDTPQIQRRSLFLPRIRRGNVTSTPPTVVATVTATYVPQIQHRTRILPRPRRGSVTPTTTSPVVVVTATFVPQVPKATRRLLPRRRGAVTSVPQTVVVRVPQIIAARRNRFGLRPRRGFVLNTLRVSADATLALADSGVGDESITISVSLAVTEGAIGDDQIVVTITEGDKTLNLTDSFITSETLHPNKTGKNTLLSVNGAWGRVKPTNPNVNDEPGGVIRG